MARRAFLAGLAASLTATVIAGCGERGQQTRTPDVTQHGATDVGALPSHRPRGCPVTPPNHSIPPGQEGNPGATRAPYHGNGRLWTVLPPSGIIRNASRRDGSIMEKGPFWRAVHGPLTISGRRLDGPAPSLRAFIPEGYNSTGFQATAIIFPEEGCWSVTARAGGASLTFVTLVAPAPPS
jgi:hypothetical protein